MNAPEFEFDHVVFDTSAIFLGKPLRGTNALLLKYYSDEFGVAPVGS